MLHCTRTRKYMYSVIINSLHVITCNNYYGFLSRMLGTNVLYTVCFISSDNVSLSLSNQAQYLMLTMESVQHFHSLMTKDSKDIMNVRIKLVWFIIV